MNELFNNNTTTLDDAVVDDDEQNIYLENFQRSKVFIFDYYNNNKRPCSVFKKTRISTKFNITNKQCLDDDKILVAYCRSEEPVQTNMDISTGHTILVSK